MSRRLWRLPPWTRAPWLGLRQPAAVAAVLVTSAILACAVASAPLFLSSARSAALQQQLAPQCAEAGWVQAGFGSQQLTQNGVATGQLASANLDEVLAGAWREQGRASSPVLATAQLVGRYRGPDGATVVAPSGEPVSIQLSLFSRPGATEHVQVVDQQPGEGIWLPAGYAQNSGIALGDTITVADRPVDVVGLYTDLFTVDPGAYWCDYRLLYANDTSSNTPPPALGIVPDPATFHRLAAGYTVVEQIAQVPLDADRLSLTDARAVRAEQERAQQRAFALADDGRTFSLTNQRLATAADRAQLIESGLRGPVIPVAVAGALLALLLVAAAGSFWADRRASEVRLLAARGVGPVPLAGKAALELGLPALAGAALGWAASRLLIAGLGPADDLDPAATSAAVWAGVAAFVVGLGAASVVAGLRARGTAERPLGATPRWPAQVPWELALLAAAAWCWALLEGRDAIVSTGGVAQVNGLLVAFPLLGIAGAAVLLARLVTALLPRLRGWAGRRAPAVFLAVNRLTAARLATATLLVAVALPVAVLGYTATLTASSQTTLDAKVGVQIGATRAVISVSRFQSTAAIDAVGTYVVRYDGSALAPSQDGGSGDRTDVQVLAVDPDDFAGTAFWDDSFADQPLAELLAALDGPEVDGRVPVVAAGLSAGDPDLWLGSQALPAQVVAEARVLPGRRSADPVVMVAADRVPDVPRSAGAGRMAEVWTDGSIGPAIDSLVAAGGVDSRELQPDQVQTNANFLGITWTFGYLSALAVFVGVIAIGGLLLYLEARSRTRVSGYVMARRLGLSRAAHLRSLVVELAGVAVAGLVLGAVLAAGAVAVVNRRLDVDRLRPPTPLLDVPWTAVAATVAGAVVVAGLAALYAQRAADRADPATVLRDDA
ncbi:putative ABC transport system permease protein [Modestobacter sp. DSM 44400]|uniref:FtsX-like permease family protein n=1 Tax=Modestobacter sp. DSM 44400 TaxID=1550230 RepID=UPI00089A8B56|nr:FtsX-like permease family protein [Modestobacter sp. DSM 44400]SDX72468.1 putative ABC transport system permease protein [Modestobacter sp. DSM 44400]